MNQAPWFWILIQISDFPIVYEALFYRLFLQKGFKLWKE